MTKDEALRLALEALESTGENDGYHGVDQYFDNVLVDKAITALRLAIDAQNMASKPTYKEQLETKDEPVPWEQFHEHMAGPNYVAPQRTWVGLTDDERKTICNLADADDWHDFQIMDATEANLKKKNT